MRQEEDKKLRDFEIQQWFYILRSQYISDGMNSAQASEQAYDDIGIRFCLRKTSIRKAKNTPRPVQERNRLLFEMKSNLAHLKKTIQILEQAIDGNK